MKKFLASTVAVCTSLMLVSCGLGTGGGFTPSGTLVGDTAEVDLTGLDISVGSKNFTEQILLGKMAVVLFQSAGATVHDLTNIPGSTSTRQAQVVGDVDFTFEYTGTAWITYLGNTDPIPDEQGQYEAVREVDLAENDLVWLPPAPMNNTYSMAVKRENAEEYGLVSLEDATGLPPEEQTYCVEAEFNARNDGFGPMLEAYDLPQPSADQVSIIDTGAIYAAIDGGTCTMGEVFTTDGRIPALDLVALEDTRSFFPKYNMAPVLRQEVYQEYPQIEELLQPITEDLTNERMQQLNAQVDVEGEEYADVAYDYLVDLGLIE